MDTVIKTVKQYSRELDEDTLRELQFIANQYKSVKNYVYSRYSGINSITLLRKEREIRDEWIRIKFYEQWKLPARYWKLALSDAFGNIRSNWTNTRRKVKEQSKRNNNLSDDDRHYINYVLKFDSYYARVLTGGKLEIPEAFKDKDLNYRYLNNLIRRYTRKYKGSIPRSNIGRSFSVDTGLYSYKSKCINITSTVKGQRLAIELTDSNHYDRTMTVHLKGNHIEIHCPLKVRKKSNCNQNIIGVDKGYRHLFAVSSGNFYGKNLNDFLSKETERLSKVNSQRNRFYALYNQYKKDGNIKKADNILKCNLGKLKYNHNRKKHDQNVKSYINHSLNSLIQNERPKEIVMEKLDFARWDDRYPKSVKRKLSRWIKGYIKERLEYKCDLNRIEYTYINPAYTSQVCNICGSFGKRNGDLFKCSYCGETHADLNAAINILNRKYDEHITLYTPYTKVRNILEKRISV